MNHTAEYELVREDDVFLLELEYTTAPIIPARTYGPPEDCYPAEGGEIESLKIMCDGKPFVLTDTEDQALEKWIYENTDYDDDGGYDYDDCRDL